MILTVITIASLLFVWGRRKSYAALKKSNATLEERVRERTATLETKMSALMNANSELERFNRTVIGREKRIIELKHEINRLSLQTGQTPPYHLPFQSEDLVASAPGLDSSKVSPGEKNPQKITASNFVEDTDEARRRLERAGDELKKRERIMQSLLEDLHESNVKTLARLAAIVEFSDDAIIGNNLDGSITSWNHGAEKIFQYSSEEVVGKGISLIVPPLSPGNGKDESLEFLKRIQQGESVEHYETVCLKKDGAAINVSMTLSPIKDNQLKTTGISIIARDITERKRLEQVKDDFLSTVSHELRTPLTILKMGIDNYERESLERLNTDEREMIQIFKKNMDRLERLINDLLDFSRLESGKTKIKPMAIRVDSLIEELTQGFQIPAKEYGIELKNKVERKPLSFEADPDLIARVLTNLFNNALRFAKSTVEVEAKQENGLIHMSIRDDGPGIKAEHLPSLFHKFIQIDRPIGGAGYKGTGLGLAISKEIIELHGGKIWAESQLGQGSQFHFTLPLKATNP